MTTRARIAVTAVLTIGVWTCARANAASDYEIVQTLPHDTGAYTQGLLHVDGRMYESTGEYGRSDVRITDLATGAVIALTPLAEDRFGEGLALLGDRLYQLTWKSEIAYVYDAATLERVDSLPYDGEGWGLTTDGTSLIMSNGTALLRFLDPATFTVIREVQVTDDGAPLTQINELEYIDGVLYANVYQSDWIVRIDPTTGAVEQWIDLAGILPEDRRTFRTDVLNGIAAADSAGHLFVTGKLWPSLFEIRLRSTAESSR